MTSKRIHPFTVPARIYCRRINFTSLISQHDSYFSRRIKIRNSHDPRRLPNVILPVSQRATRTCCDYLRFQPFLARNRHSARGFDYDVRVMRRCEKEKYVIQNGGCPITQSLHRHIPRAISLWPAACNGALTLEYIQPNNCAQRQSVLHKTLKINACTLHQ